MRRVWPFAKFVAFVAVVAIRAIGCGGGEKSGTSDAGGKASSDGHAGTSDAGGVVEPREYPSWLLWIKKLDKVPNDMARLSDGSFVVTGCVTSTDETKHNNTFIARYGVDGTLIWNRQAEGTNANCGQKIVALPDDSLVVAGYLYDTVVFAQGEPEEVQLGVPGTVNAFINKYNANSNLQWAKSINVSVSDFGFLPNGSLLVVGGFTGTAVFGEREQNKTELIARTTYLDTKNSDIFIAKYNMNGAFEWVRQPIGGDSVGITAVSVLSDGSFAVTGQFLGRLSFGIGESIQTPTNASTERRYYDSFVAKFSSDGTALWAKGVFGEPGTSGSLFPAVSEHVSALSDGSVIITGLFNNSAVFGLGEPNETTLTTSSEDDVYMFLAKYDSTGMLTWLKSVNGLGRLLDGSTERIAIDVLPDGSCYVTGSFASDKAVFGKGELNETKLSSLYGTGDIFIAKYNSDGTLAGAVSGGGKSIDYGTAITAMPDGSAIVIGTYSGGLFFEGKKIFQVERMAATPDTTEYYQYLGGAFVAQIKL